MKAKDLQAERIALFRDAANFKKTARIPHFANAVTWKIFDAGHTIDEAMKSFDVMAECVTRFLDTYPVDAVLDVGIRNQFNVTDAFGRGAYYYYTEDTVGIHDHAHCTADTLDEYMDDQLRYTWEKILPEKYGADWQNKTTGIWKNTFDEYMKYIKFIFRMSKETAKRGLPSLAPNNPMSGSINFGIEELEANLLGIRQLSLAMRRDAGKLDSFIKRWDSENITPMIEKVNGAKGPNMKYCFDASVLMLAHNIMSTKQFERFYWPHFKALLDAYAQKRMNIRIFAEGSIIRFSDYFRDYSHGLLTFHLENDDPFAIREIMPNAAIMGGMTTQKLSSATKEDCVAYTKELCDRLGQNGGFILSENKMLSYRNDAAHENMLAVSEFAAEYRL